MEFSAMGMIRNGELTIVPAHDTYIDEVSDREGDGWQAVCKGCPWAGDVQHADEYDNESDPSDAAWSAAFVNGIVHETSNN